MSKTGKPHPHPPAKESSLFGALSPTQQDLVCVGLLYIVTLIVFRAIVFENAAFQTEGDTANAHSYYQVGTTLTQKEGEDVLWMPYFFSGMPTFGNVAFVPHDVNYVQTAVSWVVNWFFFRQTWTWLVVHYFLGGPLHVPSDARARLRTAVVSVRCADVFVEPVCGRTCR